jgi:Mn2+/Fe2+ NRAMP family transporter
VPGPPVESRPGSGWRADLRSIGPGLVIAATGVGAGDLVAAAVSGSRYGFAVVWVAVVGAALKLALNEGLARWQLATGTTLLEGWVRHLGRWVQYVFLFYLAIWSFIVAGALINACGLAAHAIAPGLSVAAWGALHSVVAAVFVIFGGYRSFERLIGLFVGLMFVTLVSSAAIVAPPAQSLGAVLRDAGVPEGSPRYLLGVIGGVGGSVTLLSYGYWIREKGWSGERHLRRVRIDLAVAYGLTGIFGVSVMVLAAHVLHGSGVEIAGAAGVLQMAGMLRAVTGPVGEWIFLIGVWGAMTTSMMGVWQGVPYLFSDFVGLMQGRSPEELARSVRSESGWYRAWLIWLAGPPMIWLFFEKPVQVILLYALSSALFMPFLAGTLLYMNSRTRWVGAGLRNRWLSNAFLALCLALFAWLAWQDIERAVRAFLAG